MLLDTQALSPPRGMTVQIAGAKVARVEIPTASYCITPAPAVLGPIMLFQLLAASAEWGVAITSTAKLPAEGTFALGADPAEFSAIITDKSTPGRATWQRYGSMSGNLMFTEVGVERIAGTFALNAAPQWPQSNGPMLEVTANFAARRAGACDAD
jgi:hypothetical protein